MILQFSFVILSLTTHNFLVCANDNFLDSYDVLPKIFYFNDNVDCPENNFYCKLNIRLKPEDEKNHSKAWEIIEKKTNEEAQNYERNWIFRGVCLNDLNSLENAITNESFGKYGIVASVEKSHCSRITKLNELWDFIDIFFISAIIIYMTSIIYCTIRTLGYSKSKPDDYHFENLNPFIKSLSLLNTWRSINKPNKNEDFSKLSSIQGIRNLAILGVLIAHIYVSLGLSFSYNPEFLEKIWHIPVISLILSSGPMVVQIFFIISSWLLAVQLCKFQKNNVEITFKDILIIALNRYFRLLPAVICVIFIHRTNVTRHYIHPVYTGFNIGEIQRCRDNWWANLLFVQNLHIFGGRTCSPGTWYIAADTQLYFVMLLSFYLSRKFRIPIKYILSGVVGIAVTFQFYTALTSDFDALLRFSLRLIPHEDGLQNPDFIWAYTSTYSQVGSYVIGFIFGMIYSRRKHENIFNSTLKKIFWASCFLGLPLFTSHFYMNKYSPLIEAVKAVSFRPLFGLGFAVGILGMATNTGGYLKRIFEWKPFIFLANFTYCIYMFHFFIVFFRSCLNSKMIIHNFGEMIPSSFMNIFLSLVFGIFMFFVLEHPCLQLQKIILPQLSTRRRTEKNKIK